MICLDAERKNITKPNLHLQMFGYRDSEKDKMIEACV